MVFCYEQRLIGTARSHSFAWITLRYSSEDEFTQKAFQTMMSCITINLEQPDMIPHSLITVFHLNFLHLLIKYITIIIIAKYNFNAPLCTIYLLHLTRYIIFIYYFTITLSGSPHDLSTYCNLL